MNGTPQNETAYSPGIVSRARRYLIVISGCSGGGKSSLIEALAVRGYRTFAEPARQVIRERRFIGAGTPIDPDPYMLGELCISRTMHRMIEAADTEAPVFFDRGIVDAVSHLEYLGRQVPSHWRRAAQRFAFNRRAFIVPPWPEVFRNDAERRHSFDDAAAQYDRLLHTYRQFGYETLIVPKLPVAARVDFILDRL